MKKSTRGGAASGEDPGRPVSRYVEALSVKTKKMLVSETKDAELNVARTAPTERRARRVALMRGRADSDSSRNALGGGGIQVR